MKLLQYDQLLYFFRGLKDVFVAKEEGKGLSSNDYTANEKTKLAGIDTKAQVNKIESIKLNGTAINPDSAKAVNIDLSSYATDTELAGVKSELQTKIDAVEAGGISLETSIVDNDEKAISAGAVYEYKQSVDSSISTANSNISALQTSVAGKVNSSEKGQTNGIATLDASGKVPSSQLPSYVDDILEGHLYNAKFYEDSNHTKQITGESGKIYVDLTTNYSYRWSGSTYIKIESVDIQSITNEEIDTILSS